MAQPTAKVLSFIEPAALPLCEPVEAWEGMQMAVIERLEGLLPCWRVCCHAGGSAAMKAARARETLRALDRPIVRTAEAAAVLGISGSNASHLLASLQEAGSVMRVTPGRWAVSGRPSPYLVASWLTDPFPSYVSLYTALSRRGLITQIARTIYVVSVGRTKTVLTPVGTYSVHRLPPERFGGFEERNGERMATAEKAVFDTLYPGARARSAVQPSHRDRAARRLRAPSFPPASA